MRGLPNISMTILQNLNETMEKIEHSDLNLYDDLMIKNERFSGLNLNNVIDREDAEMKDMKEIFFRINNTLQEDRKRR